MKFTYFAFCFNISSLLVSKVLVVYVTVNARACGDFQRVQLVRVSFDVEAASYPGAVAFRRLRRENKERSASRCFPPDSPIYS